MASLEISDEQRAWISQCQGMVRSIAMRIISRLPKNVNFDDLVSYGQIGLMQAAHSFDPSQKVAFQTFAYYRIRGAIYDGLGKMSWTSRAIRQRIRAEQLSALMLEQQVQMDQNELERQASLAADAGWFVQSTEHLAMVHLLADGPDANVNMVEQFVDDETSPDERVSQNELCQMLMQLLSELPEAERQLIHLTYFDGMTITEASAQLGRSKSWGSRAHSRILERLGRALSDEKTAWQD